MRYPFGKREPLFRGVYPDRTGHSTLPTSAASPPRAPDFVNRLRAGAGALSSGSRRGLSRRGRHRCDGIGSRNRRNLRDGGDLGATSTAGAASAAGPTRARSAQPGPTRARSAQPGPTPARSAQPGPTQARSAQPGRLGGRSLVRRSRRSRCGNGFRSRRGLNRRGGSRATRLTTAGAETAAAASARGAVTAAPGRTPGGSSRSDPPAGRPGADVDTDHLLHRRPKISGSAPSTVPAFVTMNDSNSGVNSSLVIWLSETDSPDVSALTTPPMLPLAIAAATVVKTACRSIPGPVNTVVARYFHHVACECADDRQSLLGELRADRADQRGDATLKRTATRDNAFTTAMIDPHGTVVPVSAISATTGAGRAAARRSGAGRAGERPMAAAPTTAAVPRSSTSELKSP